MITPRSIGRWPSRVCRVVDDRCTWATPYRSNTLRGLFTFGLSVALTVVLPPPPRGLVARSPPVGRTGVPFRPQNTILSFNIHVCTARFYRRLRSKCIVSIRRRAVASQLITYAVHMSHNTLGNSEETVTFAKRGEEYGSWQKTLSIFKHVWLTIVVPVKKQSLKIYSNTI